MAQPNYQWQHKEQEKGGKRLFPFDSDFFLKSQDNDSFLPYQGYNIFKSLQWMLNNKILWKIKSVINLCYSIQAKNRAWRMEHMSYTLFKRNYLIFLSYLSIKVVSFHKELEVLAIWLVVLLLTLFFLLFILADVLMSITLIKFYYMDPTIPLLQQNRTWASLLMAKSKKKWLSH